MEEIATNNTGEFWVRRRLIDDMSIRSHNKLAQRRDIILWDHSAYLRKALQLVCLCNESVGECFGALTAIS